MARLCLTVRQHVPLVLLLVALIAATGFFAGALWQAYENTEMNVPATATVVAIDDLSNSIVLGQQDALITSGQLAGRPTRCEHGGMGVGCWETGGTKPVAVLSGAGSETQFAIIDPRRRISRVTLGYGQEHFDLVSQDGGLSVSASLNDQPDSIYAVDEDGNVITTVP